MRHQQETREQRERKNTEIVLNKVTVVLLMLIIETYM